jgi:hypothetical protein
MAMRPMAMRPEPGRAERAEALADIWSRVSRQHMSAAAGCSCGFGGFVVSAADFELDIVEFVIAEAETAGHPAVAPFIAAVAGRGPDRYNLAALLAALKREPPAGAEAKDLDFVLERLSTTLSSMDRNHARNRFVCD